MILSQAQRRAQGATAEDRFRAWLDRCRLPHIYVEQSPLTFPETLHGKIKRPDFLVGIPTIGTIAVDVKAKRVYADTIIIDADEHRTLTNFETYFNISVWFACFPPEEPHVCLLFLNRELANLPTRRTKGSTTVAVPLRVIHLADERRDFMAALLCAVSLR